MDSIVIERRFRGPPNSGNGGYVSGVLARHVEGSAEVTLRRPAPLDTPLDLARTENGAELRQGDILIAEARAVAFEPVAAPRVDFATAEAAAARPLWEPSRHLLPHCFVCGCGRAHGDGLRLMPGPVDPERPCGSWVCATPWIPADDLAAPDGRVDPAFLWAALDCPTGLALSAAQLSARGDPLVVLLGRFAVRIAARPRPGERCIVVAWPTGEDGRKHYAEGALLDACGETLATARATWIQVGRQAAFGA